MRFDEAPNDVEISIMSCSTSVYRRSSEALRQLLIMCSVVCLEFQWRVKVSDDLFLHNRRFVFVEGVLSQAF